MTLPLKTGILKYAIDRKGGFTVDDVIRDLDKDYHGERIFKTSVIENYIFAFCSLHMVEADEIGFDENGELRATYKITESGRSSEKYISGKMRF